MVQGILISCFFKKVVSVLGISLLRAEAYCGKVTMVTIMVTYDLY